ncbi:putative uncharacterized protein [Aliivibrio wodanis]|uniref:2-oxoadipate dioxygenase/decarboxylase n=1 Tax=Aliivibrio wodanis TaxID=80852 RepID=A0A090KFL0_9GAMM|nr:putative uncharacterized protein [Aliivibrio wodanis]
MNNVNSLFSSLWQDYIARLSPSAGKVHQLLSNNDELINDHIALRTFNLPKVGLQTLAAPFLAIGYKACETYDFEAKKLKAQHFEHPDPNAPLVFISELLVEELSPEIQDIIHGLVEQVPAHYFATSDFLSSGRPWTLSFEDYQVLAKESEYASWLAAHGYGANHFTVYVNQLEAFAEVVDVNQHLRDAGFAMNEVGGEVKGSPEVYLEQSSTMADKVKVNFTEGEFEIPGGFYEFAKRYTLPSGKIYTGFVAASADKIFESTDR